MEKNCKQGTSIVVICTKCYSDNETRHNEMGGACGMWGNKKCILSLRKDSCWKEEN
jgi:hypothetical protein